MPASYDTETSSSNAAPIEVPDDEPSAEVTITVGRGGLQRGTCRHDVLHHVIFPCQNRAKLANEEVTAATKALAEGEEGAEARLKAAK